MPISSTVGAADGPVDEAIVTARRLLRTALKASLGTIDKRGGHPFVSLVAVALTPQGAPLTLLSQLAVHTQNLSADPRAALLVEDTAGRADALSGNRLSLVGRAEPLSVATPQAALARRRFLARHPGAEIYVDFADFSFWQFHIERANLVAGFGRIRELAGADLLIDTSGSESLMAAEADIVAHMNGGHAHAVAGYATRLLGARHGDWRLCGIDPWGCDLVLGETALRLDFPFAVASPGAARTMLAELAAKAAGPAA